MDKTQLIKELRQRVASIPPLDDEPEFTTSEETMVRFLKSRDWRLQEAERMLTESVEYRRRVRPQTLDCSWCHNMPGFHSMRQVGHDEAGRPVIYANFGQAATHKNSSDDSVAHVTYLIENAKRTMRPGVSTWNFVIDCTGMTLSSCNPKLAYGVSNVLSNHYPERLGMVVCVHHNPVFHGVWKAIRNFIHPNTAAKVRLVRSKAKMVELFSDLFSPELSAWLQEEIALNKGKPLPRAQMEFWSPPEPGSRAHDPRGCPSYVSQYVESFSESCLGEGLPPEEVTTSSLSTGVSRRHRPHPNIVDQLSGREVAAVAMSKEELQERQRAQVAVESDSSEEAGAAGKDQEDGLDDGRKYDLDIPSELQIPASAVALSTPS